VWRLRQLERLLLMAGVLMIALWMAAHIDGAILSKAELQRFKNQRLVSAASSQGVALTSENPDFTLWSQRRVQDYEESLAGQFAPAIAILRIPRIDLEVPVLEGTDELSLNRGVGHVIGTANPGEHGNMAIAGHRDGFFRGLKDLSVGDAVEMDTMGRTATYIIHRITIVDPDDISVLKPGPHASLTLITCYPFYFVGSAPKRYIVQASVADCARANSRAVGDQRSKPGGFDQQANAR
jgi:sortase A